LRQFKIGKRHKRLKTLRIGHRPLAQAEIGGVENKTDPQGYETLISLSNLELAQRPDPTLFKINYEKFN
jgi:hypothetical protein